MGRPRKYLTDEEAREAQREQWRAYYARNSQHLRSKAKQRMSDKRKNATTKKAEPSESKLLPSTWKLTRGTLTVDLATSLSNLYDCLTLDMARWRTHESDEAEWRALTDKAVRAESSVTQLAALETSFSRKSELASRVNGIARAAETEAYRREPSATVLAARSRFSQLARYAMVIENGIGELLLCSRTGQGMLERCMAEKSLIWQTSL
ncbi:hypothetical protein AURDEDRAFT_166724 [Auricularia subglabra TFB-10046 SS5]|nr:hypothetical protein AURDEDRAFT_166724 [Auricularia subglabra TFB-10046 SS5]